MFYQAVVKVCLHKISFILVLYSIAYIFLYQRNLFIKICINKH